MYINMYLLRAFLQLRQRRSERAANAWPTRSQRAAGSAAGSFKFGANQYYETNLEVRSLAPNLKLPAARWLRVGCELATRAFVGCALAETLSQL
jgi:hypothetical protein